MTVIDIGFPRILLSDGDIEEIIRKHFKEQGIFINEFKFILKEITQGYGLGEHQEIIFDGALVKFTTKE